MNAITIVKNPSQIALIGRDGKLLENWRDVFFYDPAEDLWCIYYDKKENDGFVMRSDGRVIFDHIVPRRFVNGLIKIVKNDEPIKVGDLEKNGFSATFNAQHIGNTRGAYVGGDTPWCGIKRVSFSSAINNIVYEVAPFPKPEDWGGRYRAHSPNVPVFQLIIDADSMELLSKNYIKDLPFNEANIMGE